MVVIEAYDTPTTTLSVPADAEILRQTSPCIPRPQPRGTRKFPGPARPSIGAHTAPDVDPAEMGDEDERNQVSIAELDRGHSAAAKEPADDGEGGRVRSELARDLLHRVDQLVPLVGDVALATNIELLKRDLSRCHDVLLAHPSESDFLSIVTLVESAMNQLKWKQYTRSQLEAIRQAFDIGYRQVRVGFSDYERARTLVAANALETTPRIDLASLNWEEITDGEEA